MRAPRISNRNLVAGMALLATCFAALTATARAQTSTFVQTNIISDVPGTASVTDPTLINPWGVSVGPAIWIDAAGSGTVRVDTAAGAPVITNGVTIPAASTKAEHGLPSGTVYNSAGTGFNLPYGTSALFLFGTLDGTIAAWNASSGTQAVTVVNNSSSGASYTDIALDTNATATYLLAADYALGTVDVFDTNFASAKLAGNFTDPAMPTGYSPFGIHSIGGKVYVTYAQINPTTFETLGAGLGYVDVFDNEGNFVQRAVSQSVLNAPWGMALAPAGFGSFGGDLLVGNFGDGVINAFDPTSFAYVGSLSTAGGTSIANPGLWEIFFGQGGTLGDPNTLYFAAGINGEKDGLFGSIGLVQAAGTPSFTLSAAASSLTIAAGQPGSINLSLAATNGFSGPVTLACTSTTVVCTFSPSSVTLSGTNATTVGVTIAESAPTTPTTPPSGYERSMVNHPGGFIHSPAGLTLSFIGPVGLLTFAGLKRKSILGRGSLLAVLLLVIAAGVTGCGGSQSTAAATTTTPTSTTSNVTITATAGTVTQSVTIAVTAQ